MSVAYRMLIALILFVMMPGRLALIQVAQAANDKDKASAGRLAIEQFFPVIREAAPGLPDHTIYRPADLTSLAKPAAIVLWGNGGCRSGNQAAISALTLIAAHGFVVIANGAYDQPSKPENNSIAHPALLIEALDWIKDENRYRGTMLYGHVDPSRVAVMGHSCGGIEALVAAADPRVKAAVSLNSGFFPTPAGGAPALGYGREELSKLHTPTLFIDGGPSDVASQNARDNYKLVNVPAILAENSQGGHAGLWYGFRDGKPDPTITFEAITLVVQWLDLTLNSIPAAGQFFLGQQCGLCSQPAWHVSSKNF